MNDAQQPVSGTQPCKWAAWIAAAGIVVTLIGILGATPLGPFTAMLSLTLGSLLLVVGAVVATIGLVRSRGTAGQASFPLTAGALAVGVALGVFIQRQIQREANLAGVIAEVE